MKPNGLAIINGDDFYSAGNGKGIPDWTLAIQEALQAGKEGDWIIIT
ncbi:hypothetical protein J7J00_16675 [Bacillus sp. ISL-4]|nr:hypothetical protein [Bacillus sp. ISL-4]MBT2667133.1 hypothetical protein [Bacillus sp. ISL-4]MBT2673448.1 hypothetical protein [Streptomyces sp. ISL-14]